MNKDKTLTLAVSTLADNIKNAENVLLDINGCNKLIIVQGSNECFNEIKNEILYIYTNEIGISKSRNKAIENSDTDYIWFLDDDVIVNESFIKFFVSNNSVYGDVCFTRIYCSDVERIYKNYRKKRKSKLSLLQVSSIEIIASLRFLKLNNIKFNIEYGLGSRYPSGEENHFLLDCYKYSATFQDFDDFGVYHPCLENKRSAVYLWNKSGYPESKKKIANRFNVFLSSLLKIRWAYRAMLSGVSFNNIYKFLWK